MRMWVLKLRLSQKSLTEVQFYMIFNLFPYQRVPNILADSQQSIQVTLSSINLKSTKQNKNKNLMRTIASYSDEERRFMYQNRPSKSHQLPFDQGVQIHI